MQSGLYEVISLNSKLHPFRCFLSVLATTDPSELLKEEGRLQTAEEWTLFLCPAISDVGTVAIQALNDLSA